MISVIIPVYNTEKYIKKCVQSIRDQTYKDIEILLIDDGSTDDSLSICQNFERLDYRIKCIHQSNRGLSAARNKGLQNATGKYVVFLDSDDWCEKDMLMQYYSDVKSTNADNVVQGFNIDFEQSGKTLKNVVNKTYTYSREVLWQGIYELEKTGLLNSCCNKLYKMSIIKKNDLKFRLDAMPAEDLMFNCEYFKCASSVHISEYAYYHYIKREIITLTNTYREGYDEQITCYNVARKKLYETVNFPKDKAEELLLNSLSSYTLTAISNIYNSGRRLSSRQKKEKLKVLLCNSEIKYAILHSQHTNGFINIVRKLIHTNSIVICHSGLLFLFTSKRRFGRLYRIIRLHMLYGGK